MTILKALNEVTVVYEVQRQCNALQNATDLDRTSEVFSLTPRLQLYLTCRTESRSPVMSRFDHRI